MEVRLVRYPAGIINKPNAAVLSDTCGFIEDVANADTTYLSNGSLQEDRARQVVQRVIELKPRGYLAIANHFHRLVKLEIERRTAKVESAALLPADLQANVRDSLARIYGPGLNLSFAQNPALLGGLRIKVGSDFLNASCHDVLDKGGV